MKCNIIAKIIVISILSSMLIGSTSSFAEDLTSQGTSDIQDMTMEASEVTEEEVSEEVVTSENDEEGREDEKQEEENLARDSYNKTEVSYRTHVQTYGWQDYVSNGAMSGTEGEAKRLEAIEIVLVEKGGEAPGSTEGAYMNPWIGYNTHVQTFGWQGYKFDGETAGTSGLAKRLEAIQLKLIDQTYEGSLQYRTHVQTYGWQEWTADDSISGTTGEAKRLEAIQIQLTGEMAEHFDVYYRVHSQTYGWLGWAKNGESAGTEGCAKRLEAIEVLLVEKGNEVPSGGGDAFYDSTNMDSNSSENASDTENACSKGQHDWGDISWDIKNGYACNYCYNDVTDYEDKYDCHDGWHTHTFYYMPDHWVCKKCGKYLHKHQWACVGPTWSLDGTKIVREVYWVCYLCGNQSSQMGTIDAIKVSSAGYKYAPIDTWSTPYDFNNDSHEWIFEETWEEPDYTKKLEYISMEQSVSLSVGDSYSYTATCVPAGTEDQIKKLTWQTSDSSIVSVDDNGNIVAKNNGAATITAIATTDNGNLSRSSVVRVTDTNIGTVKKATLLVDGKSNPDGTITLSRNKKYSISVKTEPSQAVYEVEYTMAAGKKSPVYISKSKKAGNISIYSWANNPEYTNPATEITTSKSGTETIQATLRDIMGNVIQLEQKIIIE